MIKRGISGNISFGPTLLILIVVILGAYLFLGKGGDNGERPKKVAKRVKIEVPVTDIIVTDNNETEIIPSLTEEERVIIEEPPAITETETKIASKQKSEPVKKPVKKTKPDIAKAAPEKRVEKPVGKPEGLWAVNIVSVLSRSEAINLRNKLTQEGYNGYVTEFNNKNKLWHRVRVGFFSTKSEAHRVGKEVSGKHNLKSYWVIKPPAGEIRDYKK